MRNLVLIANSIDGNIQSLELIRNGTPRLETLAISEPLPGCGTFAVKRETIFAAIMDDDGPGIVSLHLDHTTGTLTELDRIAVDDKLTYLEVVGSDVLLGASYAGDWVGSWPLNGFTVGEALDRFFYANMHSVIHADGYVYAASLGEDALAQYRMEKSGQLTPLEPPIVWAPQGCGPRHLRARENDVYLVTEFSGELIRYRRGADGTLTESQRVFVVDESEHLKHSYYGADPLKQHLIWGADLHLAAGFVITSERTSSKLAVTRLHDDGTLGQVVGYFPTAIQPRGFAVTDELVIAVGERSTTAQLSRLEANGTLTEVGTAQVGHGANWVHVVS